MTTAPPPEATALAEELTKRLGDRPITPRQLAEQMAGVDDDDVASLLHALQVTIEALASRNVGARGDLDEDVWGPAPGEEELARAAAAGHAAVHEALDAALRGALTRDDAAARLGVTPQAVSKRLAAGSLVAFRRGREWLLPAWQFAAGGALPGLKQLVATYPGDVLALSTWATAPSVDLDGVTPAAMLGRRGGLERVLEVARASAPAW